MIGHDQENTLLFTGRIYLKGQEDDAFAKTVKAKLFLIFG